METPQLETSQLEVPQLVPTGCLTPMDRLSENFSKLTEQEAENLFEDLFSWPPSEINISAESRILSIGLPVFMRTELPLLMKFWALTEPEIFASKNTRRCAELLVTAMLARAKVCGVIGKDQEEEFIKQITLAGEEFRARLAAAQDVK